MLRKSRQTGPDNKRSRSFATYTRHRGRTPMTYYRFQRRIVGACFSCVLLAPFIVLSAAGSLRAQAPAAAAPPTRLGLAECLRIAMDNQPALAGHRASLAAAEAQSQGLQKIPVPSF